MGEKLSKKCQNQLKNTSKKIGFAPKLSLRHQTPPPFPSKVYRVVYRWKAHYKTNILAPTARDTIRSFFVFKISFHQI
jgi:hypothetical protein